MQIIVLDYKFNLVHFLEIYTTIWEYLVHLCRVAESSQKLFKNPANLEQHDSSKRKRSSRIVLQIIPWVSQKIKVLSE